MWPQVNKLKPEDILKYRQQHIDNAALARQIRRLVLKIKALDANSDVQAEEWWSYLHKTYNLSPDGAYHVTDDGRILMRPREK